MLLLLLLLLSKREKQCRISVFLPCGRLSGMYLCITCGLHFAHCLSRDTNQLLGLHFIHHLFFQPQIHKMAKIIKPEAVSRLLSFDFLEPSQIIR